MPTDSAEVLRIRADPRPRPAARPELRTKNSAIGRSGGRWLAIRRAVLERDDYRCTNCGRAVGAANLEVHHIRPRHKGGTDELSNLASLCRGCHIAQDRTPKAADRKAWEARLGL